MNSQSQRKKIVSAFRPRSAPRQFVPCQLFFVVIGFGWYYLFPLTLAIVKHNDIDIQWEVHIKINNYWQATKRRGAAIDSLLLQSRDCNDDFPALALIFTVFWHFNSLVRFFCMYTRVEGLTGREAATSSRTMRWFVGCMNLHCWLVGCKDDEAVDASLPVRL